MSHPHPAGLLAAYNSLTDKHLAGYFNNTRIRRHLLRSGLITRNGRILSEKEYKVNIMKKEHQRYIRECLARAIFHKVLDVERYRQMEIKRQLESSAKKERIQRLKGGHPRRFVESNIPILSPHPPPGPKTNRGQTVLVNQRHSSPLTLTAPRPYTAPGNMQPPIRLQPLSNYAARNASKLTPGSRSKTSLPQKEAPFPIGGENAMMKFRNSLMNNDPQRVSTYQLPLISGHVMPVAPPLPPSGKVLPEGKSEPWRRRRRLRPITTLNGPEPLLARDSGRMHKTSLHSNAIITMIYLGKNVHLSYDSKSFRDEIRVFQQHCGGENLCVYKGKLREKETFQFISKRHHGYPFSLTFFLNGIQVYRLSSCCEYKHRRSSRVGGKGGYFSFVCVDKASPCYRCIIAMGLDRKASSGTHWKDKSTDQRVALRKGQGTLRKGTENLTSRTNKMERKENSTSAIFLAQELMGVREMDTAIVEMDWRRKPGADAWEEEQESTFRYDYEEDFEVEEEKQADQANEDRQAYDQMSKISKSPTHGEKDNLGLEQEREVSSEKAQGDEEDAGCSDSEGEGDKRDIETALSTSSGSPSYSSESEADSSGRDRTARTGSSTNPSAGGSSRELSDDDTTGQRHLRAADSLPTEGKTEATPGAGVEERPRPTEQSREPASREARGEIGQIIREPLAAGFHGYSDITSGISSSEPTRKLALDSSGAPNWNSVVEERSALTSDEKSKKTVREISTLEKKVVVEGDQAPRPSDAETTGGKGEVALKEKAGATEVPVEEKQEAVEHEALAPQNSACAEGSKSHGEEALTSPGRAAARASALPAGAGAPGERALALASTALETEEAASEGQQGLAKALLTGSSTLSSQHVRPREAVTPETRETKSGGAGGEAAPQMPAVGGICEDQTSPEPEAVGPVQDAGCERKDVSGEGRPRGEDTALTRKDIVDADTPRGAEASRMDGLASSPVEGAEAEGPVTPAECTREQDGKEMLPEEFNGARGRGEVERADTPADDTGSGRAEMTRADPRRSGDTFEHEGEEGGEEGDTWKETKSEEKTTSSPNETEPDAACAESRGASDLQADPGLLEDSLRGRKVTTLEAAPKGEASLEKHVAGGLEHKAFQQGRVPHHDTRGSGGTGGRRPSADKARAPQGMAAAPGQSGECARKELEDLAGLEREGEESALQVQEAARILMPGQEIAAEGDATLAGNDEEPGGQGRSLYTLGTSELKDSPAAGDRASGGGAGGDLRGGVAGTAPERREQWAHSHGAAGGAVASLASWDGAGEARWQEAGQPLAEGSVQVPQQEAEMAMSTGEAGAGMLLKDAEGQDQGGEAGAEACRRDGASQPGAAEEGGHGAPELRREPAEAMAAPPVKADCSGTCEDEEAQGRQLLP